MIVLVLNCGSSSIKYQVIDIDEQSNALLAKGLVDRIGLPEGSLTHKPVGKLTSTISPSITSTTMLTEPCSTTTTTDNGCRLSICPTAWVIRATFIDSTRLY